MFRFLLPSALILFGFTGASMAACDQAEATPRRHYLVQYIAPDMSQSQTSHQETRVSGAQSCDGTGRARQCTGSGCAVA